MPYYAPPFVIEANTITNDKLSDVPQGTVMGRAAGVGTGDPYNLDHAGVVSVLNQAQVVLQKRAHIYSPDAGDILNIVCTAQNSIEGPSIAMIRDTPPPVAMPISVIRWYGKNSSNVLVEYGNIYSYLTNGSAGLETAEMRISTKAGGVGYNPMRWSNGVCAGYPTSGFMGDGTINAGAYYAQGIKIADGAGINVGAIPDGSIHAAKITDGTIVSADIAYASVSNDRLTAVAPSHFLGRHYTWPSGPPSYFTTNDALAQLATQSGGYYTAEGGQFDWYHRPIWHPVDGAGIGEARGGYGNMQIQGAGGGSSAMICFHRPGSFATYFGINGDNTLRIGGWSWPNAAYPVFNQSWVASKADMEANGATYVPVTPWSMRYQHGVAKAWALLNMGGGQGQSHYFSYAADLAVGRMRFHWSCGSLASIYPVYTSHQETAGEVGILTYIREWAEWWCTVATWEVTTNTWYDPTHVTCTVHGQLA